MSDGARRSAPVGASVPVSGTVVVDVPVALPTEAAAQAEEASVLDLDDRKRAVLRAVVTE